MACEFYQRVLGSRAALLKFEAAHNLSLIYVASGATALAVRVRREYCTV